MWQPLTFYINPSYCRQKWQWKMVHSRVGIYVEVCTQKIFYPSQMNAGFSYWIWLCKEKRDKFFSYKKKILVVKLSSFLLGKKYPLTQVQKIVDAYSRTWCSAIVTNFPLCSNKLSTSIFSYVCITNQVEWWVVSQLSFEHFIIKWVYLFFIIAVGSLNPWNLMHPAYKFYEKQRAGY